MDLIKSKIENLKKYQINLKEKKYYLSNYPIVIEIDINNVCNLSCLMCWKHFFPDDPKKNIEDKYISKAIFLKLIPFFKYCLIVRLFGNGEPLFRKDFTDLLDITSKYKTWIEFSTSALLLNKKIAQKIIESNVGLIYFSICGATKIIYEKIHHGSNFNRVINNILYLKELKIKNNKIFPELRIYFVLMEENFNELPALVKLAKTLTVEHITIKEMIELAPDMVVSPKKNLNSEDKKIIQETISLANKYNIILNWDCRFNNEILKINNKNRENQITEERNENIFCCSPWSFMWIDQKGNVAPCCWHYNKLYMGNLNTKELINIWNGGKWQKLRKNISHDKYKKICKKCAKKKLYSVVDPDYSGFYNCHFSKFIKTIKD